MDWIKFKIWAEAKALALMAWEERRIHAHYKKALKDYQMALKDHHTLEIYLAIIVGFGVLAYLHHAKPGLLYTLCLLASVIVACKFLQYFNIWRYRNGEPRE